MRSEVEIFYMLMDKSFIMAYFCKAKKMHLLDFFLPSYKMYCQLISTLLLIQSLVIDSIIRSECQLGN